MLEFFQDLDASLWPELATMLDDAYAWAAKIKLQKLEKKPRRSLIPRRSRLPSRWDALIAQLAEMPVGSSRSFSISPNDAGSMLLRARVDKKTKSWGWSFRTVSGTQTVVDKFIKGSRMGRKGPRKTPKETCIEDPASAKNLPTE